MSELNNPADGDKNVEAANQNENEPFSMNPLEMSEILEVLMIHSPVEALKNARLVCDLWRKEATSRLFKKGYFTVPGKFHTLAQSERDSIISHMKEFLNSNSESFESEPENQYQHQNSTKIQLPNIQLLQRPDLDIFDEINPEIIGPLVQKFVFGVHDNSNAIKMLEQLLLWRLTGLRVLDTHPLSLGNRKLPLQFCRELMLIIGKPLNFLGNPERPRNLSLTLAELTLFVDCGDDAHSMEKLDVLNRISRSIFIKKLSFGLTDFENLDSCCPDVRERISGVLSRLLERNKDVLTSLDIWGSEMYWAETVVPILPKLQHLHFSMNPPRRGNSTHGHHHHFIPEKYSLPPNFQLSVNTPNLKEFQFFYLSNDSQTSNHQAEEDNSIPNRFFLAGYFDCQKPAVSIKEMDYCDHGCDFNLDPVLKCFSALETLTYRIPIDFRKGAQSIFTWGKKLKIVRIRLSLENLTSKISSFDSILTGFSQETVDKIKNASGCTGENLKEIFGDSGSGDFSVDSLRIQPSILDLPKLELIEFTMTGNSVKYLPKKIFTVAGEYAFKLRPKLKVEFYLEKCQPQQRAKDALKDVAKLPNVEIILEDS